MRVLYLFAGLHRKAFVKCFLLKLCMQHNISLDMHELDFIRSPKNDLTQQKLKKKLRDNIKSCFYYLVLSSPPCNTFSRAQCTQ